MGADGNHVGFCGDHGKTMGGGLANQPWGNPQPIDNPTIIWSRIYGHVTAQMRKDSADRMEQMIQNVSSL